MHANHEPADAAAHRPVLLDACIEGLAIRPDGRYVDATFGRGGHSRAILARLGPQGRLLALDRDPDAVAAARELLADARFAIEHARFSTLEAVLERRGVERVDGILLDLGVSSPQFDDASRGFSFRESGPLDMRMDPTSGFSAREWLLTASEDDIARVLRDYGQERHAVSVAKAIAARRRDAGDAALQTTAELAALVAGVLRRWGATRSALGKDPSTRVFQALRILVNSELEELALVLSAAVARLAPRGRLAVISFHSLEDRLVKQFIADESGRNAPRDLIRGAVLPGFAARLAPVARVLPSPAEVAANPRARSAVLRVAERTED